MLQHSVSDLVVQLNSQDSSIASAAAKRILEIGPDSLVLAALKDTDAYGSDAGAQRAQKILRLFDTILDSNFNVAESTLIQHGIQKDAKLVRISLMHPSLIIRRKAAETLTKIGDKASIPSLIKALEDNQVVYTGGSETRVLQSELNQSIVSALRALTGLDIENKKTLSSDDIQKTVAKCWLWWKANKDKIDEM